MLCQPSTRVAASFVHSRNNKTCGVILGIYQLNSSVKKKKTGMKKICVRVCLLCRVLDFDGALPGVILTH